MKAIDTAINVDTENKKIEKPSSAPERKPTSAELLTKAKKLIGENKSDAAIGNLQMIEFGSKEYTEAQKPLKQVHARQNIILERNAAETEKRMATMRKDYAKELEFTFLDKLHMDTTVNVSGKNNTTIKIKWILWTRVTVYEFIKDGKIMSTWRSMGFKKYILTDGCRWTWTDKI